MIPDYFEQQTTADIATRRRAGRRVSGRNDSVPALLAHGRAAHRAAANRLAGTILARWSACCGGRTSLTPTSGQSRPAKYTSARLHELREAHEGNVRVLEVDVGDKHSFNGKSVTEIWRRSAEGLHPGVDPARKKRVIIPHGDTIVQQGRIHPVTLDQRKMRDEYCRSAAIPPSRSNRRHTSSRLSLIPLTARPGTRTGSRGAF